MGYLIIVSSGAINLQQVLSDKDKYMILKSDGIGTIDHVHIYCIHF